MPGSFYEEMLHWTGSGYFAAFDAQTNPNAAKDLDRARWADVELVVAQAKTGNFTSVSKLIDWYPSFHTERLRYTSGLILGDAGTRACYAQLDAIIGNDANPNRSHVYCSALAQWSNLSVVPILLREYNRFGMFDNLFGTMPGNLSRLLEAKPGFIGEPPNQSDDDEVNAYIAAVTERYEALKERFGTDDILIFEGEPFALERLAKLQLQRLGSTHREEWFQGYFRRKFEAYTGIDCSSFYQNKVFQPLAAAALLESFLEGPRAQQFASGKRYFFGHLLD